MTKCQGGRNEFPFLACQDVTLKLVGGDKLKELQAVILMQSEKGKE